jgi:hypothetical protein
LVDIIGEKVLPLPTPEQTKPDETRTFAWGASRLSGQPSDGQLLAGGRFGSTNFANWFANWHP